MTRSSSDIHFYLKIMRFSESSSKNTPKQVCHHPTLKCIKRYQDNLSNIIHPPTAQVIATLPNVTQVQVRALRNHESMHNIAQVFSPTWYKVPRHKSPLTYAQDTRFCQLQHLGCKSSTRLPESQCWCIGTS